MVVLYLIGIIIACLGIWKVSDIFEDATGYLGRNLSNGVKGASLNAIGSSMPELVTSFIFLFFIHGSEGYAGTIGTTAGSAVFNSLLIPAAVIIVVFAFGIASSRNGIQLNRRVVTRDSIYLLGSEFALILLISTDTIQWYDGFILMALYAVYAYNLYRDNKRVGEEFKYIRGRKKLTKQAWGKLIISTILMTAICWGLVYCVEQVGVLLNIPLIFVSIVLASAASSVPDTIISIKDGLNGNYDDAVANALGSNIFDICIAHGLPLFIYTLAVGPIVMTSDTTEHSVELRIALIIVTLIAATIYIFSSRIYKKHGYYFIALYVIFIAYTIARAMGVEFV